MIKGLVGVTVDTHFSSHTGVHLAVSTRVLGRAELGFRKLISVGRNVDYVGIVSTLDNNGREGAMDVSRTNQCFPRRALVLLSVPMFTGSYPSRSPVGYVKSSESRPSLPLVFTQTQPSRKSSRPSSDSVPTELPSVLQEAPRERLPQGRPAAQLRGMHERLRGQWHAWLLGASTTSRALRRCFYNNNGGNLPCH